MLRAHRQAWAWQDEWMDLTMDDIRRLEREAQIELRRKLGQPISDEEDGDGDAEDSGEETTLTSAVSVVKSNQTLPSNGAVVSGSQTSMLSSETSKLETAGSLQQPVEEEIRVPPVSVKDDTDSMEGTPKVIMRLHSENADLLERRRKSSSLRRKSLKRGSRHSRRQSSLPDTTRVDPQQLSASNILSRRHSSSTDSECLPYCGLDAVAMLNISSDDEYYDALGNCC